MLFRFDLTSVPSWERAQMANMLHIISATAGVSSVTSLVGSPQLRLCLHLLTACVQYLVFIGTSEG